MAGGGGPVDRAGAEVMGGFRDFVVTRKVRDNPRGDFILDVRRDGEFPDVRSLAELLSYLHRKDGSAATSAAREMWKEYVRAVRGSAVMGRP